MKIRPIRLCVRFFSAQTERAAQNVLPAAPPQVGYARLTHRGLISVTGDDSTTFLQGLMTQNMFISNDPSRAIRRSGSYTAFLNSQGRMLHDVFVYALPRSHVDGISLDGDSGWLIEVDKNEITRLMKHLKKYKLRAKVKLRALDEGERTVWSAWNHPSQPRWAAYNLEPEWPSSFSPPSSIVGCVDTRAPGFGSRLVTPGSEDLRTHFHDEGQVAGSDVGLGAYTVRRILHGVAEGQTEILYESALPLECNLDMTRGVDFRKGCYVGQELTIRTHHTGVIRKRILPVQLYTDEGELRASTAADMPIYDSAATVPLPPTESNISKVSTPKGRSAGKFLKGVGNIGLALCRLEMMTDVVLTGDGSQYLPTQEFKISWESTGEGSQKLEVKVKAFVPPWTKEFILSGGPKHQDFKVGDTEGRRVRDMVERLEEEVAQRRSE